jgi:PAS domain S-box-containing protein
MSSRPELQPIAGGTTGSGSDPSADQPVALGGPPAMVSSLDGLDRLVLAAAIAELGAYEHDVRTDFVMMNEAALAMFGLHAGASISFADLLNHVHSEDRERTLHALLTALEPGGPAWVELEHRVVRPDGSVRWLRLRGRAFFEVVNAEPRAVRAIGTYLDVTDRKEADERLLQKERTAREEAERVTRVKDEFIATLGHELRTPLNAILGWAQLLRRQDVGTDEIAAGVEIIHRNARAQAQLIDDLLDLSRIISGHLRIEMHHVDLAKIASLAVESIQPDAAARGVDVRSVLSAVDARMFGDGARLQQIIWNLLTNAVKFTPSGGVVEIRLEREEQRLKLGVADTGVGIAPDFLPYVFEPFRQQDASTTRRQGGVGLGLSIVKHLVELHGGVVEVTSAGLGQGASFLVELPAQLPHDGDVPDRRRRVPNDRSEVLSADFAGAPLRGVRVMVVEDEPDARDLLERVLRRAGAAVLTAGDANEALRRLPHESIDVVVSDIGLPDMDGYAFVRALRQSSSTAGVRAVAVSAYARVEDRQRALAEGYHRCLAKPVDVQQLIAVVADLVRPGAEGRRGQNADVPPGDAR